MTHTLTPLFRCVPPHRERLAAISMSDRTRTTMIVLDRHRRGNDTLVSSTCLGWQMDRSRLCASEQTSATATNRSGFFVMSKETTFQCRRAACPSHAAAACRVHSMWRLKSTSFSSAWSMSHRVLAACDASAYPIRVFDLTFCLLLLHMHALSFRDAAVEADLSSSRPATAGSPRRRAQGPSALCSALAGDEYGENRGAARCRVTVNWPLVPEGRRGSCGRKCPGGADLGRIGECR